jgi:hypothetical protein
VIRSRHGIGTNSRLLQQCFQHLPPLSPALTSKSVMFLKIVSFFFTFGKSYVAKQSEIGICTDIFAIEFIKTADLSSRLRSISELYAAIRHRLRIYGASHQPAGASDVDDANCHGGHPETASGSPDRSSDAAASFRICGAGRLRPTRSSLISTALYGAAISCLPSPVPFPLFLLIDLSIAQHENCTTTAPHCRIPRRIRRAQAPRNVATPHAN